MINTKNNIEISNTTNQLLSKLVEYNLKYIHSIKQVLLLPVVKENIKINIHIFISNLEYYFNYISTINNITFLNLSNIGIASFKASSTIRNILFNYDMSNQKDNKLLNNEIVNQLKKMNIKAITQKAEKNMEIKTRFESDEEIKFNSKKDIENYIISLIDNYDFPYSNHMEKFFLELNYEEVFKIRKTIHTQKIKYSKKRFLYLLNDLNALFHEINNIFNKSYDFPYILVQSYYLTNIGEVQRYIMKSLCCDNNQPNSYKYYSYDRNNRWKLLYEFYLGMIRLKDFYIIECGEFNNSIYGKFNNLTLDEQYNIVHSITKNLSKKSIYTIYTIRNLTFSQITERKSLLNDIDELANDFKKHYPHINIIKQELSIANKDIVDIFIKNFEQYKKRFNDFTFIDLNTCEIQNSSKIELISFEVKYNDIPFKVKIVQFNLSLFSYIYFDTISFSKDQIFTIQDFDRIFYIIKQSAYKYK